MKLIFEKSVKGRKNDYLADLDVPRYDLPEKYLRSKRPALPELAETDISRHYSGLAKNVYGVNSGFYPLGSCTMKYNPKLNEEMAAQKGFLNIHPLQPPETVKGCTEVFNTLEAYLCEITGMDKMCMQPAAGAHGEFLGLLLIKEYHKGTGRNKIIVPDSAHGTNPASAAMAGFSVVNIPSGEDGCIDVEKLKAAVDEETAGLMLTNPNTLGLFDKNILEITEIVHKAGGLNYYDGANLNAVMGIARPGDMGFDIVHLNLHKTFSTPHGGGGPGSGPVGCKAFLADYLPGGAKSIGRVRAFHGNFLVMVKALTYILTLGRDGIKEAAQNAVLNANYMLKRISEKYDTVSKRCMHEFVITLEELKKKTGVSALDVAKALMDYGIHPPTMYFPLIVKEALMVEPTETETKSTMDEAVEAFFEIYEKALNDPESLKQSPKNTFIGRPDDAAAARNPVLKYEEGTV